jgi:hypothetical protein
MSSFRLGLPLFASITALAGAAFADRSTIKSDYDHPSYTFEAEPRNIALTMWVGFPVWSVGVSFLL